VNGSILSQGKNTFDILMQAGLIFFQRQHIICSLLNNLQSNLFLTPHSINGNDAIFNIQHLKEARDGLNFIGFFSCFNLPQQDTIVHSPSANQMEELVVFSFIC